MSESYVPTVLITGAKSGIGLEFGRQFAERGWNVIATHHSAEAPELVREAMEKYPTIRYARIDVSDPAAIRAAAFEMRDQPIDVLINNAGICYDDSATGVEKSKFGQCDPGQFQRVYAVNVLGPVLVAEAFTDHIRRGEHKKIVSISSTNGSLTAVLPGTSIYYKSSKAALNRAMICVAEALREEGITVALIHPGAVSTEKNMSMGSGYYPGMIPTPYSVKGMMEVIDRLAVENTGKFYNYDCGFAPW